MALKDKSRVVTRSSIFKLILLSSIGFALNAYLDNFTSNDPSPVFSTYYPFYYLSIKQKAHLMRFDNCYPVTKFRISGSGYRQSANYGRDQDRNGVNLGDMNGRWNMFSPFYDPALANKLFNLIGDPSSACKPFITQPNLSDKNQEFGFFTVPMLYRKNGVRFEAEMLLVDSCYYAIGLRAQFGVADIRQTVLGFSDLTCQALGISCPAYNGTTEPTDPPEPLAQAPVAVAVPYINQETNPIPPCPAESPCVVVGPTTPVSCVPLTQTFKPCEDTTLCLGYTSECKKYVIQNIMDNSNEIFDCLGIDTCNFNKVGLEDLRLNLYWRQIFIINQENQFFPRLLFMPFIDIGVGIPLDKPKDPFKAFALPTGNDGFASAGMSAGFTLDYLNTIDLVFEGGFTKFFQKALCDISLPTNKKESGFFPYRADINMTPGTTWRFGIGMHAYHFLDNLNFWQEWLILSHRPDKIEVCRSFIPEDSIYYKQGFLVDQAECLSKWEVVLVNTALDYDLSPHLSIGLLWQAPVRQRNAYQSGTVMGSINYIY